jgi:hypothetical protein
MELAITGVVGKKCFIKVTNNLCSGNFKNEEGKHQRHLYKRPTEGYQ